LATIISYKPQSARIPSGAGLARDLWSAKSHLAGVERFDESDLAQYDRDTIFYDLFLNYRNDRLIAIGPPLVNLEKILLPMQVYISGAGHNNTGPIRYGFSRFHNTVVYSFKLPGPKPVREPIRVRITFANGLETTFTAEPAHYKETFLALTTLQKDNPIEWIRDWANYHYCHGVDRLILYDNGSRNFGQLQQGLTELPEDLEIILVSWDYKYGMVRSHKNKFCRTAYFNHFHTRFGPSVWFLSLDIDEYLVIRKKDTLLEDYLKGRSRLTGLIRFDSYMVPNIGNFASDTLPSVRDFAFREKAVRGRAKKYLLRQTAHKFSRSHKARLRFPYRKTEAATNELLFFHYTRISTNWKERYYDRFKRQAFNENDHVEDRAVIDFMAANDRHE